MRARSFSAPPPLPDTVIERAFCDADAIAQAWSTAAALVPEALALEAAAESPGVALVKLVRLLGSRGLLGLVVPEAEGGSFPVVRSVALCLARERLGHASPLVELAFAMQALGTAPIVTAGDPDLRAALLPRVAAGELVTAFALTEREAGSDLGGIATTARRDGDAYVLDGEKIFISNAGIASLYVVFAATAPAEKKRRLSAFVVEGDRPGLSTRPQHVLGGHPIGVLTLDGVRVPASRRLGDEGDGMAIALSTLHRLRPTVGAAAVGFAQRALDETVRHVRARRQFGAPLSEREVIQMRVADMALEVEGARLLVYRAAARADLVAELERMNGAPEPTRRAEVARTASMAKLAATEAAQRVVDQAVQLHGGRGVEEGSVVARLYEDVRALRIYEGASDVQRLLIAREVLRGPAGG